MLTFYSHHWRVKAHGIQVVKLCYLGGREFRVLKKLRDRFVGRVLREWKSPSEAKKSTHFQYGRLIDLRIDNPVSNYEATGIWDTRNSLLWAWRRVREYLNEWFDLADGHKDAYALMRS